MGCSLPHSQTPGLPDSRVLAAKPRLGLPFCLTVASLSLDRTPRGFLTLGQSSCYTWRGRQPTRTSLAEALVGQDLDLAQVGRRLCPFGHRTPWTALSRAITARAALQSARGLSLRPPLTWFLWPEALLDCPSAPGNGRRYHPWLVWSFPFHLPLGQALASPVFLAGSFVT